MNANAVAHRRFRCIGKLNKKMQSIANVALTPSQISRFGPRDGTYITCDFPVVVQLNAEVPDVVDALSEIEAGATEHTGRSMAPIGPATVAVSATLPVNPPVPVTVTVEVAAVPAATLIEAGLALRLNAPPPPPPPVIVSVAAAAVDVLKLASPLYDAVNE